MLVSDIITRVRDIVSDEDGSRWSEQRLIRELNAAQVDFCRKTNVLRSAESIIVHSGQSIYELPKDLRLLSRVLYNDNLLSFISSEALDRQDSSWEASTGTPKYAVYDKLNRRLLKLSPTPSFETTNSFLDNYLTIYYLKNPALVTEPTDLLELDALYLEPLVFFITGSLLRSDMDTQNRTVGNEQLHLYAAAVRESYIEAAKDFTTDANIRTFDYRSF